MARNTYQDRVTVARRRLSRYGCRNCKLRKIKCDQAKPHCSPCRSYQVVCNFQHGVADLQPVAQYNSSAFLSRRMPRKHIIFLHRPAAPLDTAIWTGHGDDFHQLNVQDQELFRRFRLRTMSSLGGRAVVSLYEHNILRQAFFYPPLMHGVLAVAAAHGRYLDGKELTYHQLEAYHSYRSVSLFRTWLLELDLPQIACLTDGQRDAIWATAVVLAILSFSAISVSAPEDAWPLGTCDSSALAWLQLKMNDQSLWHLADPTRPGSAFHSVFSSDILPEAYESLPSQGTDGLPAELASLCRLHEKSSKHNSPYFLFAHALARLQQIADNSVSLGSIFKAVTYDVPQLLSLLRNKDPTALCLLQRWYSASRRHAWWIDFRARYEELAIDGYIQRRTRKSGIEHCLPAEA